MEETLKAVSITEQLNPKSVDIFINSKMFSIAGNWQWDMDSDAIFCSDVILETLPRIVATKGIIHPDDLQQLKQSIIALQTQQKIDLEFRMINTYGEVKNITGKNCFRTEADEQKIFDPEKEILKKSLEANELTKLSEALYQHKEKAEYVERITKSGTWYLVANTNQIFYSDNLFRLHGVIPQSLNSHLNTFTTFIHPDDRNEVTETFDKAYKAVLPLYLQYRIITANGYEKYLSVTTHWSHNNKGEYILNAFVQDETDLVKEREKAEQTESDLTFHKQLIYLNDESGNISFWYTNLLTRQTYYSDNYYRMHGLKPQAITPPASFFLNYIYPDDRDKVMDTSHLLKNQHTASDIEYRIVRSDKKIRYLHQSVKLLKHGGELIMTGIIKDVTAEKISEDKLNDLNENLFMKELAYGQTEDVTGTCSWVENIVTGNIVWSDNIYNLLGYKKSVRELTLKALLHSVVPEDRKKFTDEIAVAKEQPGQRELIFRVLKIGEIRYMKGVFKLMKAGGKTFFVASLKDITQEHLLQQELFEGLQLNQMLAENIVDRIFITDHNNNIVMWNKKCEIFFELKKEYVTGLNYFDVFPQFKTDENILRFTKVLKGDIVHEQNERSSQKEFHTLRMIPLKNKENAVAGILHVQHDVTQEVQLMHSLNERINFIEKLLEETVDRIIVLDKNLNFTYWNKKAEQHYRINKEYIIGKNLTEVFPSLTNNIFYYELKKALRGETIYIPSTKDDDEGAYNESYIIPLLSDRKEVNSLLWITHDLTLEVQLQQEQRKAEEQINESGKLLESVFNVSKNAVMVLRSIRNSDGEIEDFECLLTNSASVMLAGKDLKGKSHGKEYPGIYATQIFEQYKRVVEENIIANFNQEYNTDGVHGTFNIIAIKLDDGLVATAENITSQKNAEAILKSKEDELQQKLITEKASALLIKQRDEFMSIASHELKTPVSNIKASIQLLQNMVAELPALKNVDRIVSTSVRQVNKLNDLIDDLFDVAKLEGGTLALRKKEFNLREAIEESVEEFGNIQPDANIKIEGEKELKVSADKVLIQQVLTNYLSNAIKYSPQNKNVNISIEKNKTEIKILVKDKGIGISIEKLPHVFDKYFRVDETSKHFKGLGLGLYISKQIIKKHGGNVGVESVEGEGSSFWFCLPL